MIYQVMQRIVDQSIPAQAVNTGEYIWYPYSNTLQHDGINEQVAHDFTRYERILDIAHAFFEQDKYCPTAPTAIIRNFEEDMEMPAAELDSLFRALIRSNKWLLSSEKNSDATFAHTIFGMMVSKHVLC